MDKVLDAVRGFCRKAAGAVSDNIDFKKIKKFFRKNWRYFAAVLLFVVLVLILYNCTGPSEETSDTESTEPAEVSVADFVLDEEFEQDAHTEVNELIENYFAAYADGDIEGLLTYAYPLSDNEKSYIETCSRYVEGYQNISCYTKSGLTAGSYLVSAYYELKFYDVETVAPGLEFFYVETDETGSLYINNLYCAYNRDRMEAEMDSSIYTIYVLYGQQEDVQQLRKEVQAAYQEALSADVDLVTMLTTTFPDAIEEWKDTMLALAQDGEEDTEADTQEDAEPSDGDEEQGDAEDDTPEEEPEQSEEETVVKVSIAVNSLNVRAEASTDSASLGKVSLGQTFTKLGESGEWTQIDYNGTPAYVKTEYIQEVAGE